METKILFFGDIVGSVIEPGFTKVVVEGDWTNAVRVSARLTIDVTFDRPARPTIERKGTVRQFDFTTLEGLVVEGPFNLQLGAVIKLFWSPGDYAHFPSSDVDFLIATGPTFDTIVSFTGATLNSPEEAILARSGTFFIFIIGFEINPLPTRARPDVKENWTLQIFNPA